MKSRSQRLFALLLILAGMGMVHTHAGNDTVIRLAVLAEDVSSESRALADLLTADLSRAAGIQVVERAEIDRVLVEQNLSAAGLVRTDQRVAIGRLLRAQGLIFVRYEPRNKRWLTRLVETRQGFQAGLFTQPYATNAFADAAKAVAKNLLPMVPKLTMDLSQWKMVSILRINNAILSAQYDWIEDAVPTLLTECLSKDPNIIVLERRQLGELLGESKLTGDAAKFSSSGILIDGELTRTPGPITVGGETSVTFTVYFRDASLREIKQINQHGSLRAINQLIADATMAARDAVRDITHISGSNTTEEAQSLLNLAKWHGSLWAADAAYALSTTNTAARDTLIKGLMDRAFGEIIDAPMTEYVERAQTLAKAERLCRENRVPLLKNLPPDISRNMQYLMNPRTMTNPEIRSLLKPFRHALRQELEATKNIRAPERNLMRLAEYGSAFFDNPLDGMLYTRSLFNDIVSDSSISSITRDHVIGFMLTSCVWTPELFESLTNAPDPVIRYYTNVRLMRFYSNMGKRLSFAMRACQDLDAVLTRENSFGIAGTSLVWLSPSIENIINVCPEQRAVINAKMFEKMESLLASTNFQAISLIEPQRYLIYAPPADAIRWIDAVKAMNPTEASTGLPKFPLDQMLGRLNSMRLIAEKRCPAVSKPSGIQRKVLLSPDGNSCAWKSAWPANFDRDWTSINIYPQRLFVEGYTLWIGLGGKPSRVDKTSLHPCGMMQVDLKTGNVISCRIGQTKGSPVAVPNSTPLTLWQSIGDFKKRDIYPMAILPMFRWRDWIVVAQAGVGVILYSARATATWSDLKNVKIINEQSGLLSNYVQMLTCLDDCLYIVCHLRDESDGRTLGSALMEWNSRTKSVSLLADDKQGTKGLVGLPEFEKTFADIRPDITNHCLNVTCLLWTLQGGGGKSSGQYGIWSYFPKTKTWQCAFTSSVPYRAASSCDAQGRKCQVWPSGLEKTFDAQDWDKDTLAITGYGKQWKLEQFTKESSPAASATQMVAATVSSDNASALINAARDGDIHKLQELAVKGQNLNIQDMNGHTPLISAIDAKQSDAALWLIRQGADINFVTRTGGGTPLVFAAWRDLGIVVTELLSRNADPNSGFNNGQTALMLAAANGNLDMVKSLIEKGARATSVDSKDQNAFVWSANASKPNVLNYFIQNMPDKDSINKALFRAVQSSQSNNITLLIKHGADLKSRASCGCSLINRAAISSEPEIVQYLADEGADLNFPDCDGDPPVMSAALKERPDNVGILFRAGADFLKTGQAGRTVYDYCKHSRVEVRAFVFEAVGKYVLKTFDDQDSPLGIPSFSSSP